MSRGDEWHPAAKQMIHISPIDHVGEIKDFIGATVRERIGTFIAQAGGGLALYGRAVDDQVALGRHSTSQ